MKRILLATFLALAFLTPAAAIAQDARFVYRHELRGFVVVPQAPATGYAAAPTPSVEARIARHQLTAASFRGGRAAQAAVHCDRLIAELREGKK